MSCNFHGALICRYLFCQTRRAFWVTSLEKVKHGGLQGVLGVLHHPRPGLHLHLEEQALEAPMDRHRGHRLLRRLEADLQLLHGVEQGPSVHFSLNSPNRTT